MPYITLFVADEMAETIKNTLQELLNGLEPFRVNLDNKLKKRARTMAASREGLARLVSHITNAHPNSLAREIDPAELALRLNYDASMEALRQLIMKLLETIAETQLANGIDAMMLVDQCIASLQISRKYNASLDLAMQEVDNWNNRFINKRY